MKGASEKGTIFQWVDGRAARFELATPSPPDTDLSRRDTSVLPMRIPSRIYSTSSSGMHTERGEFRFQVDVHASRGAPSGVKARSQTLRDFLAATRSRVAFLGLSARPLKMRRWQCSQDHPLRGGAGTGPSRLWPADFRFQNRESSTNWEARFSSSIASAPSSVETPASVDLRAKLTRTSACWRRWPPWRR
jgi:hypothetical protein